MHGFLHYDAIQVDVVDRQHLVAGLQGTAPEEIQVNRGHRNIYNTLDITSAAWGSMEIPNISFYQYFFSLWLFLIFYFYFHFL